MYAALAATLMALESGCLIGWNPQRYRNRSGIPGVTVKFRCANQHHRISVHNCRVLPTMAQVAELISKVERVLEGKCGFYSNHKGVAGFYATGWSRRSLEDGSGHWCMISRSGE
jgi:hypothetical protein